MLRLLGQHVALRVNVTKGPLFTGAVVSQLVTRPSTYARTFLSVTRPLLVEKDTATKRKAPAAKSDTATGDKKTPAKSASKTTAATKEPAKKPVKKPVKAAVKSKAYVPLTRMKISREDRPPTGRRSPFVFFIQEFLKTRVSKSLKDSAEYMSQAGQEWRALSESEKQKYQDASAEDTKRYLRDMIEYVERVDPQVLKAINVQRKAKGQQRWKVPPEAKPKREKRPLSSFMRFLRDPPPEVVAKLEGLGDMTWLKRNSILGEEWRQLSAETKASYTEAAKKEREEWRAQHGSATTSA
ncbi:hypothetical protein POSPLADRAFT_1040011 [Postia placenta MAD-698-R-SB12]|uniref:HMG box domain-containing protein n=1 Tax=Postia placenta MAD-698-R-SB12 TaxID=670580 RepID=A0A1X6N1E1_9APHY|nr:hypothetical protein POSPLADRAFT_1040011 [Postia placenta MAD-698-R-SB12]OSX62320.1 hypothetical protein POSPLADRAFT_1040011 [Postia placenta MAD-698-R-SB12]